MNFWVSQWRKQAILTALITTLSANAAIHA